MARNRNRRRRYYNHHAQRVTPDNANRRLLQNDIWSRDMRLVEDRRLWHPDPVRPALNTLGVRHRLMREALSKTYRSAYAQKFATPKLYTNQWRSISGPIAFTDRNTLVCVRRRSRREVLFAKRKTGKGARRTFRHRNYFTSIKCR